MKVKGDGADAAVEEMVALKTGGRIYRVQAIPSKSK
jgi:hypothetical protein